MSQLFSPVAIGPLQLKNRVAIAPMCQYSAVDGLPQPWHVQHIGRLAISGAGLTIVEATGVDAQGLPRQIVRSGSSNGRSFQLRLRYSRFNDPALRVDLP